MHEEIEHDRDRETESSSFQEYWPDWIPEEEREERYNNEMSLLKAKKEREKLAEEAKWR